MGTPPSAENSACLFWRRTPTGLAHTHTPDMLLVPDCRSLSSLVDCAWCSLPLSLTFLHPQFRAARVKCIATHSIEPISLLHHGARDPQGAAPTSFAACRQTGQPHRRPLPQQQQQQQPQRPPQPSCDYPSQIDIEPRKLIIRAPQRPQCGPLHRGCRAESESLQYSRCIYGRSGHRSWRTEGEEQEQGQGKGKEQRQGQREVYSREGQRERCGDGSETRRWKHWPFSSMLMPCGHPSRIEQPHFTQPGSVQCGHETHWTSSGPWTSPPETPALASTFRSSMEVDSTMRTQLTRTSPSIFLDFLARAAASRPTFHNSTTTSRSTWPTRGAKGGGKGTAASRKRSADSQLSKGSAQDID